MRGRLQGLQVWASELTVSVLLHFVAASALAGLLLKLLVRQHFRAFLFLLVLCGTLLPSLSAAPPVDKRPFFVVVYADWCPNCQQIKPALALINEKYQSRIRFVRFDITSEETTAASRKQAVKLGLAQFFDKNHDRTAVVMILDYSGHEIFRTVNDDDPQHYETVLDQQLQLASTK